MRSAQRVVLVEGLWSGDPSDHYVVSALVQALLCSVQIGPGCAFGIGVPGRSGDAYGSLSIHPLMDRFLCPDADQHNWLSLLSQ
jgi:hypothetical protein